MENNEESENENYEPCVTSRNPTERILARRLRIQRRIEALRKQKEALADTTGEHAESEIVKTPIEIQIDKSTELLEKLLVEGEEFVTNVRTASEAREVDRREREGINRNKLLQELEEEAVAAEGMFNEIANKWAGILKYNDPLQINEEIISQKEKCDELIRQKDSIIAILKDKLKREEINFARDQDKQMQDINSLTSRIEKQIVVMRKAYRQEIQMVEEVIMAERQLLIEVNNKKWEELAKKRDQEEMNNAEKKSEEYWQFFKDMEDLNQDFRELYRATTIKLENECDDLQKELERIKIDALINSEKLDYNYQILRKREDENLIINSQQKRRINKLQDAINSSRKKIHEYRQHTTQQIDKLTEEVKKLTRNVLDIENKADHIAKVNDIKFKKIWNMNKEKTDKLYEKILEIDRILHEQQLGLVWISPPTKVPSKTDLDSYKVAVNVISEATRDTKKGKLNKSIVKEKVEAYCVDGNLDEFAPYKRTVNNILNLIADKTGFLIEDQLNKILEPYLEKEKTLVKVDNVFTALNVTEKYDIDLLLEFFLPFMFCPICNVSDKGDEESLMRIHDMDHGSYADVGSISSKGKEFPDESEDFTIPGVDIEEGGTVIECGPLSITLYDDSLRGECRGPEGIVTDVQNQGNEVTATTSEALMRDRVPCQLSHPLMMSSVYVVKALKEFLGKYHTPKDSMPTMSARLAHKRSTISRLIAPSDIESYWKKYTELFPGERVQLWDGLLEGLKRYHELLKVRKITSEEVVDLRHQNLELRKVFANYIDPNEIPYEI